MAGLRTASAGEGVSRAMALYLASLGAGLLVGVLYGLMQVRSPAPPAIALLGLLGMLIGEQVIAWWRGHVDLAQAVHRVSHQPEHRS